MNTGAYEWRTESIADRYVYHFDEIKTWFEYDPQDAQASEQRMKWLARTDYLRVNRQQLVEVLMRYNEHVGNGQAALDAIALLGDERTLAVVGGQQAGLFSGPLLVIYKAVTIIQVARRESKRLGCPVVPVFWIAGEDHDIAEVNHTYVLTQDYDMRKLSLAMDVTERKPVSHLGVDSEQWRSCISSLEGLLPDTEFKAELIEQLGTIACQADTLSDFMARILVSLFGQHGLIVLDAADYHLRQIEAPMFEQLIEANEAINEALFEGKHRLNAVGYKEQAEVRARQANLFVIDRGERKLLFQTEQGFTDRLGEVQYTEAELITMARTSPELLSNNLFTRPLMQEYLFPTLHTVLGPGEIAYWSQLKEAFRCVGMRMPIIAPRLSYTLIESPIRRHMERYDMTFDDVVNSLSGKRDAWLSQQDHMNVLSQFEQVKSDFASLYEPLLTQLAHIHKGMQQLGETNMEKIMQQINFLQSRTQHALETQHQTAMRHFERMALNLLPLGKPQERVYNIFAYLNKYGFAWIDELVYGEYTDDQQHTIVYM